MSVLVLGRMSTIKTVLLDLRIMDYDMLKYSRSNFHTRYITPKSLSKTFCCCNCLIRGLNDSRAYCWCCWCNLCEDCSGAQGELVCRGCRFDRIVVPEEFDKLADKDLSADQLSADNGL